MKSQKMARAGIGGYGRRTGGCQTPKCLAHIQRMRTAFPLKCARQMLTSSLRAVRISLGCVKLCESCLRDQSGWKQWPKLRRKYANRRNGI